LQKSWNPAPPDEVVEVPEDELVDVPPPDEVPPEDVPPDEAAGVVACGVAAGVGVAAGAALLLDDEDVAGVTLDDEPVDDEVSGVVDVVVVDVVDVSADVSAAVVSPLSPATSASETVITGVAVGTASETWVPPQADRPAPRVRAVRPMAR
jgi:hypothetical protein